MTTATLPRPALRSPANAQLESFEPRTGGSPAVSPPRRTWRVVLRALFVLYLFILGELGCRLYWWGARGVSPHRMDLLPTAYFPEMARSGVLDAPRDRNDSTFDVLVLGGSVLHRRWGGVDRRLRDELSRFTTKRVRIYNVSEPGHTTRDSLLKYRALDGRAFDLVIVYHGMNDVRQNNVARAAFKPDYGHCGWYRRLSAIESHPERGWLALPCTLHCAWVGLLEATGACLPRDTPRNGWGPEGLDVKTGEPFGDNLREIATTAGARGDRVALMTFGHRAERYLPFRDLVTGVNAWGTADGVVAGMAVHNAAARQVAAERPNAIFVDQADGIPATDHYFTDPCHLTNEGLRLWVSNLSRSLSQAGF